MNGWINSGDKDSSDNESGFEYDLWGVTAGMDYRFRPNLIGGTAFGFTQVDTDYDGNRGGMEIDSRNGSAFLTYFRDSAFYVDALASVGSNDYDSTRRIRFDTATTAVDRLAGGSTDETGSGGLELRIDDQSVRSTSSNVGGHLSYAMATGWGVLIPQAQIDWVHEFEENRRRVYIPLPTRSIRR